jgi:hypothetical protein
MALIRAEIALPDELTLRASARVLAPPAFQDSDPWNAAESRFRGEQVRALILVTARYREIAGSKSRLNPSDLPDGCTFINVEVHVSGISFDHIRSSRSIGFHSRDGCWKTVLPGEEEEDGGGERGNLNFSGFFQSLKRDESGGRDENDRGQRVNRIDRQEITRICKGTLCMGTECRGRVCGKNLIPLPLFAVFNKMRKPLLARVLSLIALRRGRCAQIRGSVLIIIHRCIINGIRNSQAQVAKTPCYSTRIDLS